MFENPRRGRQARNFGKNFPKILDLKSSSEQIFSENCRWVPLKTDFEHSPWWMRFPPRAIMGLMALGSHVTRNSPVSSFPMPLNKKTKDASLQC